MHTAQEWRNRACAKAEVVDLPLPSGMTIRARRPGPMQLAQWNKLPLMLVTMEGGAAAEAIGLGEAKGIAEFMRDLLVYCCVEPRVSDDGEDDTIHPREIPEADWIAIVQWAMRVQEAAAVRPFRPGGDVRGAGGDGENVLVQTVGSDGHGRPGDGASDRPGGSEAGVGSAERGA